MLPLTGTFSLAMFNNVGSLTISEKSSEEIMALHDFCQYESRDQAHYWCLKPNHKTLSKDNLIEEKANAAHKMLALCKEAESAKGCPVPRRWHRSTKSSAELTLGMCKVFVRKSAARLQTTYTGHVFAPAGKWQPMRGLQRVNLVQRREREREREEKEH